MLVSQVSLFVFIENTSGFFPGTTKWSSNFIVFPDFRNQEIGDLSHNYQKTAYFIHDGQDTVGPLNDRGHGFDHMLVLAVPHARC